MPRLQLTFLLALLAACGAPDDQENEDDDEKKEEWALPVRVEGPSRGTVEDFVETQANLEAERRADVHAEVDGLVVKRVRDLGDRVGGDRNGEDPFLLARLDDRDLALALQESEILLREKRGRIRELGLEAQRAARQLEQSNVALDEAEATLRRTTSGIADRVISAEEHEGATFGVETARAAVSASKAAHDKAAVALELGSVAVEQAQVARDRAALLLEKTVLRAPFAGVVTTCNVREGERVRVGDHLYRIEQPDSLLVYGEMPVRQANRIDPGDRAAISSNATAAPTTGEVLLVAPTVTSDSGTVRVKVRVAPKEGFKPGLFVTLRIVVETRDDALVVPKRAVLHDDETGAYLFVVLEEKAKRLEVRTGFERGELIEIAAGLEPDAQVVVEGQDTLTDGARVEVRPGA